MTLVERTAAPELLAALAPLVARAAERDAPTLVSATLPVRDVDPLALYAAATPERASLWLQAEAGYALVGIGEAWATRPQGPQRFRLASEAWRRLLETAIVDAVGSPRMCGPLLLGGFAFSQQPRPTPTWDGFEAGCLTLPTLLLTSTPAGSWLTVSLVWAPGPDRIPTRLDDLASLWTGLPGAPSLPAVPDPPTLRFRDQQPQHDAWRASVARLAGAIGRGRLDKAVLSRRVTVEASAAIDVSVVLQRLREAAPESTIFAFGRGRRVFVGATPERLVSLEGREVRTMAMAGSARRGEWPAADDALATGLRASDKEREEHAVVVGMLREALTPLTTELRIAPAPAVVRLRHVQHLVTPVDAQLAQDADVLELAARLHPTPAVGGWPRDLALELIEEEEPHERGWYAGPVGWIDRHGEGEFVVALRSGVIAGTEATLFAGCGIVADSDPEREWDESAVKLQALGSALGRFEA
jgi:isochorismate synthase